jgi:hypothetical protein
MVIPLSNMDKSENLFDDDICAAVEPIENPEC